jgi:hypothetical protein
MQMRLPPFVDRPSVYDEARARYAAKRARRAEFERRRSYGLRQRHSERLARIAYIDWLVRTSSPEAEQTDAAQFAPLESGRHFLAASRVDQQPDVTRHAGP